MTYPAASANLIVLWGRWYDHLTKTGVDAEIVATPKFAAGQSGAQYPNLTSLVDEADLKTGVWRTRPLTSGMWALPLLPTNDQQFGAFGGYEIAAGQEPKFIVEILENTATVTATQEMIDALNVARVQSSASSLGIGVGDTVQAVWVRHAAVLQTPAVVPPPGVLTSDQVVSMIAGAVQGIRQLPTGGAPGQVPTPKVGGGYEWTAHLASGDATPDMKGVARLAGGTADNPTTPWSKVTDVPPNPLGTGQLLDQTGHIPRIIIDTVGAAPIADRVTYVDATMTINGARPYAGPLQIRGRGNTTWSASKKPYRIKLADAAALLGMPAERDWVLLANAYDPTSIRNVLAFEIGARCSGLAWTPRSRLVELTLNGVFMGLYQFAEHVEISAQKLNATKATSTTGQALTGAYTLEVDQRLGQDPTEVGFRTTLKNVPVVLDDPDGTTAAHKTYIQQWINDFEAVLYGSSWLDPATGYARLIDRDSFIDWYLVNELLATQDSNFYSSCKLYKTRDTDAAPGRLAMGPLWDFDLSSGNTKYGSGLATATGWWTRVPAGDHPGALWIDRMLGDPAFFSALITRWTSLVAALTTGDSVFAVIDRLTDRLTFATARDRRVWAYSADPAALGDALRVWLRTRITWLSSQFVADTTAPGVPGNLAVAPGVAKNTVTWNAATDNVSVLRYRLRRSGTVIADVYGTSYVDTGLTVGTSYSYTVTAVDVAGNESAASSAVSGTPVAAGPATVSSANLVAWYKADAITGVADAATLATWPDSSGMDRTLTGVGAPTLRTAQLNGKPSVRLNGSGAYLTNDVVNHAQPLTVFVVARSTAAPAQDIPIIAPGDNIDLKMYLSSAGRLNTFYGAYGPDSPVKTLTDPHVFESVINGTSSLNAIDGAASTGGGAGTKTLTKLTVGTSAGRNGPYFGGDLFEVLVYTGAMSAADRSAVRQALATKYALTVTA